MARSEGIIHRRLPPDAILHTRNPVRPETTDTEKVVTGAEALGAARFAEAMELLANQVENRRMVVDEYNSGSVSGAGSSASVTVQPNYEYTPEKIEAIIITGVPGNINLQLGDRFWSLTIPASGLLVIAPVAILLSRSDNRILTPATPGIFTLELMGIADKRFET